MFYLFFIIINLIIKRYTSIIYYIISFSLYIINEKYIKIINTFIILFDFIFLGLDLLILACIKRSSNLTTFIDQLLLYYNTYITLIILEILHYNTGIIKLYYIILLYYIPNLVLYKLYYIISIILFGWY